MPGDEFVLRRTGNLTAAYDVLSVGDGGWPVETLSECLSDEGPRSRMMSARPCVDFMQQLLSLVDRDATHQNARSAPFVKISIDEDEEFCSACDAAGFCLVGWEFAFHDPLKDWEPPIGIL